MAGSTNLTPPAGALFFPLDVGVNAIQNGSPDGVVLLNTRSQTVLDSFSYEGAMTNANVNWFSRPINLVRGTALATSVADLNTSTGSLIRWPNGLTTYNDTNDWRFTTTITPGTANVP